MTALLAYAQAPDTSASNLVVVLISLGAIAGCALAVMVPVFFAWSRQHRRSEAVMGFAVLWGLLTAASIIVTSVNQMDWSRKRQELVNTGYYDPNDVSQAPALPLKSWGALAAGYGGLIAWSLSQRNAATTL